jgi:hypothetical protein
VAATPESDSGKASSSCGGVIAKLRLSNPQVSTERMKKRVRRKQVQPPVAECPCGRTPVMRRWLNGEPCKRQARKPDAPTPVELTMRKRSNLSFGSFSARSFRKKRRSGKLPQDGGV